MRHSTWEGDGGFVYSGEKPTTSVRRNTVYTEDELREMIKKMHDASGIYYALAVQTGCHTFIEFTGLINEFIKLCEQALVDGIDFTQASIHSGQHLPFEPYHIAYLREKLECIYGPDVLDQLAKQPK